MTLEEAQAEIVVLRVHNFILRRTLATVASETARLQEMATAGDISTIGESAEIHIGELGFSTRAYNCLQKDGINTLAELLKRDEGSLYEIRGLGRQSIVEIERTLFERFRVKFADGSPTLVALLEDPPI